MPAVKSRMALISDFRLTELGARPIVRVVSAAPNIHRRRTSVLVVLGIFRLVKACLLLLLGLVAARIITDPVGFAAIAHHLIERVKLDPDNEQLHGLLARILNVPEGKLRVLSIGSFIYAAGFAVEGVGLIGGWHWAEWMVVVTTSLLLPYEVYEMIHRASWLKAGVIVLNVAIVWYLVHRLRRDRREAVELAKPG